MVPEVFQSFDKVSLEQLDTALSGAWEKVEVLSNWVQTRDLHQTPGQTSPLERTQ